MNIHEMQRILDNITYKDWEFKLGRKGSVIYLQVQFKAPCADDHNVPSMEVQKGRKWMLSKHMTKSELVQTALKAVLTAEEHEARERFQYCSQAIFGPHFHVAELWKLSAADAVDIRDDLPSEDIDRPKNEIIENPESADIGDIIMHWIKLAKAIVNGDKLMDRDTDMGPNNFEDLPLQSLSEPWPIPGVTKMTKESHK